MYIGTLSNVFNHLLPKTKLCHLPVFSIFINKLIEKNISNVYSRLLLASRRTILKEECLPDHIKYGRIYISVAEFIIKSHLLQLGHVSLVDDIINYTLI